MINLGQSADRPVNVIAPESGVFGTAPKPRHQLDWQAYFKSFNELHGGNPIHWGGRLLYQDAWQYSITDHAGPEFAPPEDQREVKSLKRSYWLRRKAIVENELRQLSLHITYLEEMQRLRHVPLQQVLTWFDMEQRRWSRQVGVLDMSGMKERCNWLKDDVELCNERIKELE